MIRIIILALFLTFWSRFPVKPYGDAGYIENGLECQLIEKTVMVITI